MSREFTMGNPFSQRDQNTIDQSSKNEPSNAVSYINSPESHRRNQKHHQSFRLHKSQKYKNVDAAQGDALYFKKQGESMDNRRPVNYERGQHKYSVKESQEIKIGTLENII